jgi:hypothetical protein
MSNALTGDYLSLAEACGEVEPKPRGWVPGVDFDPTDPDEMEVMELVWERERHDTLAAKDREIASLRARLAEYEGEDEGGYDDGYPGEY